MRKGLNHNCTVRRKLLRTTTEIVGFVKDWEIIADNLSKAGWSWGCVSAIDELRRMKASAIGLPSTEDCSRTNG
jgi:hypothetical protein